MPKRYTFEEVKDFIESNGAELLSKNYISSKHKLDVRCRCGEVYKVRFEHFKRLNKSRCNKCAGYYKPTIAEVRKFTIENSDCICLSTTYKNNSTNLLFKCSCGDTFETTFKRFKLGRQRCSTCLNKILSKKFSKPHDVFVEDVRNISKGEKEISEWLIDNRITFKEQFKISGCENKRKLPFDFAVFNRGNLTCLIEYDGIQHFDRRCFGGEKQFLKTKKNDHIKTSFCEENGIKLIRIPYTKKDNIDEILADALI